MVDKFIRISEEMKKSRQKNMTYGESIMTLLSICR